MRIEEFVLMAVSANKRKYMVIFERPVFEALEKLGKKEDRKVTYLVNRICKEYLKDQGLMPREPEE